MLVHRNDDIVCSFWPTPRAGDGDHGGPNSRDSKGKPALSGAVAMWPTPSASDAIRGDCESERNRRSPHLVSAVKMWATPSASDSIGSHGGGQGRSLQTDIYNAQRVSLWSTPVANDAKNATLPPATENRDSLPGDLRRSGEKGSLNPAWVESLQGLPLGWTDADAEETEAERLRQSLPWPAFMGQEQYGWEPPRVAAGIKNRMARLKALGNCIVPAQIAPIFAAIVAYEHQVAEGESE